jgi:hypothetical protein
MSKGMILFLMLPSDIVNHYANAKGMKPIDLCSLVAKDNQRWVNNVANQNQFITLADLCHDFVGLMQNDEHFIPRL